ncbi:MAG: 3-hydroxyacyl-CoA dehydrogenase NAD-binding domain-containing protein [Pseudomonadota bacterium]
MPVIDIEVSENVALVALNNPPVNAMSGALRTELVDALATLDADPNIQVIALFGRGKGFSAGADISEFGGALSSPLPPDVTKAIEACNTPLVAVLHGSALGGGLEMGLAAHARVATPTARMGLPEVTIGLLPGAGGCTRLPHVAGWDAACDIITSGRHLSAQEALSLGIVDKVEDGAPEDLARAAAQAVLDGTLRTRKSSEIPLAADDGTVDAWAKTITQRAPQLLAPQKALEAISNATLPVDEALEKEQQLFMDCLKSPQSAALIHAFFAERAVWKIPEAGATPRDVHEIGVIGGGTMGSGIATSALLSGYRVTLVEMNEDAAERAKQTVAKNLGGALKRGKISEEKMTALLEDALSTAVGYAALASADVIIEAVFENMDLKKKIFAELDQLAKPGAILASNTSGLDIDEIAAVTSRPGDVIGLHFFSPAHVMRLLEVVVGAKTALEVVATGFAMAKSMRKVPVRAGVCDGFIGNRILFHYLDAADKLVLEGASPAAVDQAMQDFGFALGPFAVNDLAGLDIGVATRSNSGKERVSGVEQRMVDNGWLGRKTGKGHYVYGDGAPVPNPDVATVIAEEQAARGITPRDIAVGEIVDRILMAMISEATRVLEEGIAGKPVDIDAVYLFGYGFPRFQGGPMHYADSIGLQTVLDKINAFAAADPEFWRAPELLTRLASDGANFASLNKAN